MLASTIIYQCAYKPGSVPLKKAFVIYLLLSSRIVSSNLPPDIGRTALHASVYLVLQSVVRTATYVAIHAGGLLPHLLTLTLAGGYFLLRSPTIADSFYFQKHGVLYCPDFPLAICIASDKPAYCFYLTAKILHFLFLEQKSALFF